MGPMENLTYSKVEHHEGMSRGGNVIRSNVGQKKDNGVSPVLYITNS